MSACHPPTPRTPLATEPNTPYCPVNGVDPSGLAPYVNRYHQSGNSYWNGDPMDDPAFRVPQTLPIGQALRTRMPSTSSVPRGSGTSPAPIPGPIPRRTRKGNPSLERPKPVTLNRNEPTSECKEPMRFGARFPDFWGLHPSFAIPVLGGGLNGLVTSGGAKHGGLAFGMMFPPGPGVSIGPGWRFNGVNSESLDGTLTGWGVTLSGGVILGGAWSISLPSGSSTGQALLTTPSVGITFSYTW